MIAADRFLLPPLDQCDYRELLFSATTLVPTFTPAQVGCGTSGFVQLRCIR